ncbi:MAG: hypothetical protein DGJ47_000177 [Rickettsiaceae bacterium]
MNREILMNSNNISWYGVFKIIIFNILIILPLSSQAKVMSLKSIDESFKQKLLNWADENTVILIEVDGTIMVPQSDMFAKSKSPYNNFINNLAKLGKRNDNYNSMIAQWYQQRKVKLVDEQWVEVIESLKENGAKIFGICSHPIHLLNIEQKRLYELGNFGIKFTNEIGNNAQFIIKKQGDWFARFDRGVIFTGPYSQSRIIMDFLRYTYIPKKLMIISHKEREIEHIDKKLRIFNIKFYSIKYYGAKQISNKPIKEVVEFQQRELMTKKVWHEDESVKQILNIR